MVRLACLGVLVAALPLMAQPKNAPEAFSFDPQPKTLEPARPYWWHVAVSPDGKTFITAHAVEGGGVWWVWDAAKGTVTDRVREPNVVRFVAFSPDGSLVATANFDNAVRIYDAKTRQLVAYGHANAGGHTAGVNALAFSGDSKRLATAGLDKTARLWDVAEALARSRADGGNQAVVVAPRAIFEGNEQAVYSVGLNGDGTKLVTGGQDGSVHLWNVPTIKAGATAHVGIDKAKKLSGHGITVECVAMSRDGKRIASGSWDNTAKLYDGDGKDVATLRGHNRGVMALAFSPDGSLLATASGDHTAPVAGEVRLWDAADGKDRGLVGKHEDMALGVAFGPEGRTLVTVGRDRCIREWDVATRTARRTLRPADSDGEDAKMIQAITYSPDGKQLAVADEGGTITLWSLADRKRLASLTGHIGPVHALAWSKDGMVMASASSDKTAILWDMETHKTRYTLRHPGAVYAVAVSADGKTVATGGFDKIVRLWNAATGEESSKREGHTASVRSLAFGPDGELASGGADFAIYRWSPSGERVGELRGHTRAVRSLAYLAPGLMASGGDDGRVIVWSLAEGEPRHTFGPYADGISSIAGSPKGTFLVAGLATGRVNVLDPVEGQTRAVLPGATEPVAAVAVSPDGRQVAAGGFDRVVRLWTASSKPAVAEVVFGHEGPVRATAVSPDGALVATGDAAGTIHLFDAATGQEKSRWEAHKGAVEDVAFSADGTALISGGADGAIVWRTATHEVLHRLGDHPGPVRRVALNATAKLAATASTDSDVRVHDLAKGTVKKLTVDGPIVALQFLADDGLLTAAGPHAYIWDIGEARVADNLDGGQFARINGAAATGDGKLVALAGDPTPGTQRPEDIGNSRVLAVARHHPTNVHQRMDDTGVGISRLAVSRNANLIAAVSGDGTVRVWDWPRLSPIRKFPAHAAAVLGLALSADGEYAVTASADGTVRRWSASRGDPLVFAAKLLDESKQTWFARVSPDGKTLITGGDDKVLRIRDAVPGGFTTVPGEYGCTFATAVSPDGSILATGHIDGDIRLWDLKTLKQMKKLEGHSHRVWSLAFSPDGSRLVSGGGNWDEGGPGEIRVWDTTTWKTVHQISAHDDLVFEVAVSPDNQRIASCSRDHTVRTWDLATGKPEHILRMHAAPVRSVAFTRDGKRLYSGDLEGRLRWWDPVNGKAIDGRSLDVRAVARVRLSPDGTKLALGLNPASNLGAVAVWDIETNEVVHTFPAHDGQINNVAFSPDGKTVVSVGGRHTSVTRYEAGPVGPWVASVAVTRDGKTGTRSAPVSEIRCWDVTTGTPLAALPGHKLWLEAVTFTPDGSKLITAGGIFGQPGEIRLTDFAGIRPLAALPATDGLMCGKFSPDGATFATGTGGGALLLWNVEKARRGDPAARTVIPAHKGLVRNLAWFPDGSRVVTSGEDGTVRVWDPIAKNAAVTFSAADRAVYGVAVSPDGTMIATAAGDWKNRKNGQVRVWDTAKGTELFRLPDTDGPAWGVAFTADGRLIVDQMGDTAVRVFDFKTKKEVKALTAATDARGLTLSADGKRVGITAQANGLVKIWDAGTWREAYEVTAHPGKVVFTVEFAADGQTVLTAGGDGAAVVWKIPGGSWTVPGYVPPAPPKLQPLAPGFEKD